MALSANTALQIRGNISDAPYQHIVIKTAAVIYHHALVGRNAAGTVVPLANNPTISFLGLAEITDPTGADGVTGDGTAVIKVITGGIEILIPKAATMTAGLLEDVVYGVDDASATNLATLGPAIGTFSEISGSSAWVRLRSPTMANAS